MQKFSKEWYNKPMGKRNLGPDPGKLRFFFYGQLKVKGRPNTHTTRGSLRHDGTDAAFRAGGASATPVYGQVMWVAKDKVAKLDRFEAPEYRRTIIRLSDGSHAYCYQYVKGDFFSFPVIKGGNYVGKLSTARQDGLFLED